jgi:DNA-binding HxlR family transcriptional regulator
MPRLYGQNCPVARSLDLLGDRWTLLIVRDLLRGRGRFQDLLESLPGIAPNILSDRLKLLEAHGVVTRRFYSVHPPRAAYVLTERGQELGVVIGGLASWGARHAGSPFTPVHTTCGHPAEVVYRCPRCAEPLSREAIELRHSDATAEPTPAPPIVDSTPAPRAPSE